MNAQSKCLVTGAAGFIGSHLVDRLLQRGATVFGIDNLKLGRLNNLAAALRHPHFTFTRLDLNDLPGVRQFVAAAAAAGPLHCAWHLAANSDIRAGVADPEVDLRDTFLTTHHLLRVLHEFQIPHLAFASTSAIYGSHPGLLTENHGPLFPISNYGAMKLAGEAAISSALEAFLERAWIFRFPNVVGSRSTHGAIYDFVQKLKHDPANLQVLGDGSQEKPYLHVDELIEAMLFIVEQAGERLNFFNIGTDGSTTTVRHIAETVVRLQAPGAKISYGQGNKGWVGDVPKFNYSIDKLKKLGWRPNLTSNQAVEKAAAESVAEGRPCPAVAQPADATAKRPG